jgi:hypothetical protein
MSVCGFDQDYVAAPGARPLRARPAGVLAATTIGLASLAVLGIAIAFVKTPPAEAEAKTASVEAIVPPARSEAPAFDLTAPEFAKEKKTFAVRKLDGSEAREESLTLGKFATSEPYLRLDIRPLGGEKHAPSDFYLDLTRHATQAGLAVAKITQPAPLATRFGAFEAADIRLSQPASSEGPATERSCLALRLASASAPVEIAGLVCGGAAKQMDRRALGCIVDRLEYPAGDNAALNQFFLNSEQGRGKACGEGAPAAAAAKASWFEAHSAAPQGKTEPLPPKHTKKAH